MRVRSTAGSEGRWPCYRLHAHANDSTRAYGVSVNPDKSAAIAFAERDRIIVLAEE